MKGVRGEGGGGGGMACHLTQAVQVVLRAQNPVGSQPGPGDSHSWAVHGWGELRVLTLETAQVL